MISKNDFFKAIETHQEFEEAIERLSSAIAGNNRSVFIYDADWVDAEGRLFDILLNSNFTEEGVDTIYWWLYESVDKVIYVTEEADMFREETEKAVPVRTIGQLWSFFEREPEIYFKNA